MSLSNLSRGRESENLATPKPDVFELESVHYEGGINHSQEQSFVLDGRTQRTRWRTIDSAKYIPVSIFPAVYAVHRLYRNYRPRRLPTLTSLTLLELYVAAATPVLVSCLWLADAGDTIRDPDRHTILFAAKRFQSVLNSDSSLRRSLTNLDAKMSKTPAGRAEQARLRWLREGNIIQRAVWWYRHPAWFDRGIWNGVAMLLLEEYKEKLREHPGPPVETLRRDWDLCVTFIATWTQLNEIHEWREKARNLFAASLPVAWLARWSGRPLLYLPMGGVQRILLGAFLTPTGHPRPGVQAALVWWYRHPLWSGDQSTWNEVAMLLLEEYKQKLEDTRPPVETLRRAWDVCVTYLTTTALLNRSPQLMNPLFRIFAIRLCPKMGEKAQTLLAASIPLVWVARFSGRPLLYLPMGGVPHLLLCVVLYADWANNAGLFYHLKHIRDKATFAYLVTSVLGEVRVRLAIPKGECAELFELFD
uniref:Cercosporin MFS transporter CTB4 (Cercosporin toxin biosynthesis cluster protein 4) n=1 Tax=Ganoderma boninense TaxID=34458 RepID=A0A5K1JY44_9APHY|nr:Cercosporin MFS transporter CTB4 (Cercosporin toxin biosynthesis cluster protein 4) [Ganoderma boninense]